MSDDREAQSKFDRPASSSGGVPSPARPVAPPAPPPPPPATPRDPAQVKNPPPASGPLAAGSGPAEALRAWPPTGSEATHPGAAPSAVPGSGYADAVPAAAVRASQDSVPAADVPPLTFVERLRRLPPAPTILTVGSIGSLLFLLWAVTSHTTPVAVLMSAGVVTGLIFGVDAVIASIATWRLSQTEESGRALLMALAGGLAYLVSLTSFAGVVVMILVLNV
jgi:hypothetical protein